MSHSDARYRSEEIAPQDQFAIKDLGVACAQKNRMLFVYVLVSLSLNSSFRLNGGEDLREEETLTLIQ